MLGNIRLQHIRRWRQHGKTSCALVVVKTKVKSALLLWHHHGGNNMSFQLKLANFLVT